MPRGKKIQTTLDNAKNDSAWKTIGRAKRQVQSTEPTQELKDSKKTDVKLTPPHPLIIQQQHMILFKLLSRNRRSYQPRKSPMQSPS
jgi:hypothetical protein